MGPARRFRCDCSRFAQPVYLLYLTRMHHQALCHPHNAAEQLDNSLLPFPLLCPTASVSWSVAEGSVLGGGGGQPTFIRASTPPQKKTPLQDYCSRWVAKNLQMASEASTCFSLP